MLEIAQGLIADGYSGGRSMIVLCSSVAASNQVFVRREERPASELYVGLPTTG